MRIPRSAYWAHQWSWTLRRISVSLSQKSAGLWVNLMSRCRQRMNTLKVCIPIIKLSAGYTSEASVAALIYKCLQFECLSWAISPRYHKNFLSTSYMANQPYICMHNELPQIETIVYLGLWLWPTRSWLVATAFEINVSDHRHSADIHVYKRAEKNSFGAPHKN